MRLFWPNSWQMSAPY